MGQYSVTSQIERLLAKEYHRMELVIRTAFLIMLCLGVTIHQSPLTMEEADRSTMIDKDNPFVTLTREKRSILQGPQLGSLLRRLGFPGVGSLVERIGSPTNPERCCSCGNHTCNTVCCPNKVKCPEGECHCFLGTCSKFCCGKK